VSICNCPNRPFLPHLRGCFANPPGVVEELTFAITRHFIGPGHRCSCGSFAANNDPWRTAEHLAKSIPADLAARGWEIVPKEAKP
jgi:hypothetical protein